MMKSVTEKYEISYCKSCYLILIYSTSHSFFTMNFIHDSYTRCDSALRHTGNQPNSILCYFTMTLVPWSLETASVLRLSETTLVFPPHLSFTRPFACLNQLLRSVGAFTSFLAYCEVKCLYYSEYVKFSPLRPLTQKGGHAWPRVLHRTEKS